MPSLVAARSVLAASGSRAHWFAPSRWAAIRVEAPKAIDRAAIARARLNTLSDVTVTRPDAIRLSTPRWLSWTRTFCMTLRIHLPHLEPTQHPSPRQQVIG